MTINKDMIYVFDGPAGFVILHEGTKKAIHTIIDKAIAELSEDERSSAEADREYLYNQILGYYSEYGSLPDFMLKKRVHDNLGNI